MLKTGLLCLALIMASIPAHAQDKANAPAAITEAQITAYYDEINHSYKRPFAEHLAVLKAAFAPHFKAVVSSTITMPGTAPMQTQDAVDYAKLIDEAQTGYDAMKTATITHAMSDIVLAADGRSVKVRETTKIKRISTATPQGTIYADAESVCDDELALSAAGKLQAVKSSCTMDVIVTPEREL